MSSLSRRIAYSATFTAISVAAILISRFVPITVTALLVCAVCYFLSFTVCGLGYGLLTIAASLLTAFLLGGISTVFIFDGLLFAPYSLIAYFMKKLPYRGLYAAIRIAIVLIFINAVFAIIYFALTGQVSYDFGALTKRLGGYAVVAAAVSAVAVATDYLVCQATEYLLKRIK